jgi:hypothetical protein
LIQNNNCFLNQHQKTKERKKKKSSKKKMASDDEKEDAWKTSFVEYREAVRRMKALRARMDELNEENEQIYNVFVSHFKHLRKEGVERGWVMTREQSESATVESTDSSSPADTPPPAKKPKKQASPPPSKESSSSSSTTSTLSPAKKPKKTNGAVEKPSKEKSKTSTLSESTPKKEDTSPGDALDAEDRAQLVKLCESRKMKLVYAPTRRTGKSLARKHYAECQMLDTGAHTFFKVVPPHKVPLAPALDLEPIAKTSIPKIFNVWPASGDSDDDVDRRVNIVVARKFGNRYVTSGGVYRAIYPDDWFEAKNSSAALTGDSDDTSTAATAGQKSVDKKLAATDLGVFLQACPKIKTTTSDVGAADDAQKEK